MGKGNTEKKTKRKYIPGLAQLKFELEYDWTASEAKKLFTKTKSSLALDSIKFEDSIAGMKSMPPSSVDLIIADPPFGIDFTGKGSQYNRKRALVEDGYVEISKDYTTFTKNWIGCLSHIMKEKASAYIISGWTNLNAVLSAIESSELKLINHIIWKYQFGVFTKRKFVSSHYHILFVVKEDNYFFNKYEYYPEDVWEIPRTYHPGMKKNGTKLPEALVSRCIQFSSKPGDIIFDPFMGNATTAVCAKGLYRHYFGFELNLNMEEIHQSNLDKIALGAFYHPLKEFLPTQEKLLEKYPHLKKHIE
ncbi:hypothetical protein NEF87_004738 [Candidatus Lokiarchaeum ossiferum]|uniref:Type II methyltransferase n=1 Tax=Candidatus Lokiarchaeum ossiferum TaxID=2951803 RepID=A0ABY6HYI5_9ARCH|nr:hypothetical protein NEF87_004738 [Candidatus Lokiarchaeum sp. B-35]